MSTKPSDIAAEIVSILNDRRFYEGEGEGYFPHVESHGGGFISMTYEINGVRRSFMIEVKALDE